MVTLQILVLSFLVRVRVPQQLKMPSCGKALGFFVLNYCSTIQFYQLMKKLFLPFLLFVAVSAQAAENPVLTIEGGQVQGIVADDHPDVFVYRGIPYAAPPIRENRWREPQPVQPWKGVKICDTFGRPSYQAIQYTGGYYTEWGYGKEAAFSEDCLYLNVWTKAPGQVNKKLPVALWNRPRAKGDSHNVRTLPPPALCPKIVTLLGSPPNWAMFFLIHFRASIWSRIP